MKCFIELWSAKESWLKMTKEVRGNYLEQIGPALQDLLEKGVETIKYQSMKKNMYTCQFLFFFFFIPYLITAQGQSGNNSPTQQQINGWNNALLHSKIFTRNHNLLLEKAIKDIPPGKALDVTMGEGRNTLFLASQGWETTGFDIANVAIDSVKAKAKREKLNIHAVVSTDEDFDYGEEKWDLIALIYSDVVCGGCCAYDADYISKVYQALKPGGRIVYEWYTREALIKVNPSVTNKEFWGCKDKTMLKSIEANEGFKIVYYDEKPGIPDWDPSMKFEPIKLIYLIAEKE